MTDTLHWRLLREIVVLCVLVASIMMPSAAQAVHNYDHCLETADPTYCDENNKLPSDFDKFLFFKKTDLKLLQPMDPGQSTLPPENDIQLFYTYFNIVWPWVLGIAAGIAVLQALIGGIQIMLSGSGNASEPGKTRLMWALAGMLMIGLAGAILESLNPTFYIQQ